MIKYLSEVKEELKKVSWPTKQEVINMTSMVVAVSLAVGLILTTVDAVFTKLISYLVSLK